MYYVIVLAVLIVRAMLDSSPAPTSAKDSVQISILSVMPAGKRYRVEDSSLFVPTDDIPMANECKELEYKDDFCTLHLRLSSVASKPFIVDRISLYRIITDDSTWSYKNIKYDCAMINQALVDWGWSYDILVPANKHRDVTLRIPFFAFVRDGSNIPVTHDQVDEAIDYAIHSGTHIKGCLISQGVLEATSLPVSGVGTAKVVTDGPLH